MSIIRGFFSRNLKSEKIIFSNTNIEESRQKRYNRFMIVMKFGGTSVKTADRIREACEIIRKTAQEDRVTVVASAMKGVTEALISSGKTAEKRDESYRMVIEEVRNRQYEAIEALFSGSDKASVKAGIDAFLQEWEEILIGVSLVKNCSPRSADLIAGMGERMNNYIIARYLESTGTPAVYIDAREIIKTDDNYGAANVLFDVSVPLIRSRIAAVKGIPVVTGFISSTVNGISTTLGRNGSDYTAGILGHALDASRIEIWTDVDGVMSADPRIVEKALVIPEISSFEAMELSYLGAQVIHPSTMAPALEKGIPIFIKNTMNPTAAGTKIVCTPVLHETPITGIAVMNDICLINIEGSGMIGKPGIAAEVFSALAKRKINVIMISQCSSEHSICFACSRKEAADAADALKCDLAKYLEQRIISGIQTTADCVTVAVIGENMIGSPGIAGKIFSALGDASVNVLAIAQGSSERNVSAIISAADKEAAVKAVHKKFFGV